MNVKMLIEWTPYAVDPRDVTKVVEALMLLRKINKDKEGKESYDQVTFQVEGFNSESPADVVPF
jgi:hypothetical protein